MGAIGTRLSLRPLDEEGGTLRPNLARTCGENADSYLAVIASEAKQSILFCRCENGLLRGACHRARVRATRWLAMTDEIGFSGCLKIGSSCVVPANAGTHNHRRLLGAIAVRHLAKMLGRGVWVPAPRAQLRTRRGRYLS